MTEKVGTGEQRATGIRATVVIPSRDGASRLPGLLEALTCQSPEEAPEILVVEDGSAEIPPESLAGFPGVRLLRQPRRGPGSARNRGAAQAAGEFLIFLDDDCVPEPQWLSEMLRPFSDARVVGVKGAYRTDQSGIVPRFVQAEYEEKYARLARKPFINFVDGYSAGFRRQTFEQAGGFDESFPLPSVEDREFSLRVSRGKGLMVFNPRAVVRHQHVAGFAGYLAKKFKYGRWGARILRSMPAEFVGDDHTPHTQRLQVLLMLLLPFVLASSALWSLWTLAAWAAVFWGSSLGLMRRASSFGWEVGFATFPLTFLRALGLASGLAWGTVARTGARGRAPQQSCREYGTDESTAATDS